MNVPKECSPDYLIKFRESFTIDIFACRKINVYFCCKPTLKILLWLDRDPHSTPLGLRAMQNYAVDADVLKFIIAEEFHPSISTPTDLIDRKWESQYCIMTSNTIVLWMLKKRFPIAVIYGHLLLHKTIHFMHLTIVILKLLGWYVLFSTKW